MTLAYSTLDNLVLAGVVTETVHKPDEIVSLGSLQVGWQYQIESVGSSDFTRIGAELNTVGQTFTFNGVTLPPNGSAIHNSSALNAISGHKYTIRSLNSTNFVSLGAPENTVGIEFTASSNGISGAAARVHTLSTSRDRLTAGKWYTILFAGTMNFKAIGSSSNEEGQKFQANSAAPNAIGDGIVVSEDLTVIGDFIKNHTYKIVALNNTDFTTIGASENSVDIEFVATASGTHGTIDETFLAGDFVNGTSYTIKTVGLTDFTTIGASSNDVGTVFTATGDGESGLLKLPNTPEGGDLFITNTKNLSPGMSVSFKSDVINTGVDHGSGSGSGVLAGQEYFIANESFAPSHFKLVLDYNLPATVPNLVTTSNVTNLQSDYSSYRVTPNQGAKIITNDSPSTDAVIIDYTSYYERIASALEQLVDLAKNDGIRVSKPYDWVGASTLIKNYQENGVNLEELKSLIDSLPKY